MAGYGLPLRCPKCPYKDYFGLLKHPGVKAVPCPNCGSTLVAVKIPKERIAVSSAIAFLLVWWSTAIVTGARLVGADSGSSVIGVDIGQIQALSQLGATGILITFFGLTLMRKLITMGEKKDSDAAWEARMAEIRIDRDAWKLMAQASTDAVKKLTDSLETQNELVERQRRRT